MSVSSETSSMLIEANDLKEKIVLAIGPECNSLASYAAEAGAAKVYVDKAFDNGRLLENSIPVKIEDYDQHEKVDIILSLPSQTIFVKRMLIMYTKASNWLKPDGIMFPYQCNLHMALYFDETVHLEQLQQSQLWLSKTFGSSLSVNFRNKVGNFYHRRPLIDTFDNEIRLCDPVIKSVKFLDTENVDLNKIVFHFNSIKMPPGKYNGIVFWATFKLKEKETHPEFSMRYLFDGFHEYFESTKVNGTVSLNGNDFDYDVTTNLKINDGCLFSQTYFSEYIHVRALQLLPKMDEPFSSPTSSSQVHSNLFSELRSIVLDKSDQARFRRLIKMIKGYFRNQPKHLK